MHAPTSDKPSAKRRSRRVIGRSVVPDSEEIIFDCRPSLWLVVLRAVPAVVPVLAGAFLLDRAFGSVRRLFGPGGVHQDGMAVDVGTWIIFAAGCISVGIVVWAVLDWLCRRYVLTDRRAIVIFGVLHQRVAELALERVQNVAVSKPLIARLLGLGHVGLASAGTDGFEIVWRGLSKPDRRAGQVRAAVVGRGT